MKKYTLFFLVLLTLIVVCGAFALRKGRFHYGQWAYSQLLKSNFSEVEDPALRAKLPLHQFIPAAPLEKLTRRKAGRDDEEYRRWERSYGGHDSSKFAAIDQINRENVHRLEMAWIHSSPGFHSQVQANPIYFDGLVYTATEDDCLVALRAHSGEEAWRYRSTARMPARRGMVLWRGFEGDEPRLIFPEGANLVSLSAKSGQLVESFGMRGKVTTGTAGSTAPAILGDRLLHATMEPAVQCFDLKTGELIWKFSILPQQKGELYEKGLYRPGGGNPWAGMALDRERGILFVSTGNPAPNIVGVRRPGRNPNTCSVIAIDVATGTEMWSFQEIAHDLWDLDIPASPILTSVIRNGVEVDVVVAVTKAGNTLILDRMSGQTLFDFRLRRAPTSDVPGEQTWPYQPDLQLPEPFSKQVFDLREVTDIGERNRESVLRQLKDAKFGFFEAPAVGKPLAFFGLHGGAMWPGPAADPRNGRLYVASNNILNSVSVFQPLDRAPFGKGKELQQGELLYSQYCAMCHDTQQGSRIGPALFSVGRILSAHTIERIILEGQKGMPPMPHLDVDQRRTIAEWITEESARLGGVQKVSDGFTLERTPYQKILDFEGYPGNKPPWGTLSAIDLNSGRIDWQVPLGEYSELSARGIPQTGTENFGGPIVTSGGLIFVSGTKDKMIRAFDVDDGRELWAHKLPFNGSASPCTYVYNGVQYVVLPASGGGTLGLYDQHVEVGSALVAFALPVE